MIFTFSHSVSSTHFPLLVEERGLEIQFGGRERDRFVVRAVRWWGLLKSKSNQIGESNVVSGHTNERLYHQQELYRRSGLLPFSIRWGERCAAVCDSAVRVARQPVRQPGERL